MNDDIFNRVADNDKRLENVTMYKLTEGYSKQQPSTSLDALLKHGGSVELTAEIQKELAIKKEFQDNYRRVFGYFKRLVLNKEITLEELEDRIFAKYGAVTDDQRDSLNPFAYMHFTVMTEERREEIKKEMR